MANYIVPLVTIPYLARVLGAAGWGLVAFAQAFGSYVTLFGDYAFAYSATREVARYRDNREKLAQITSGVLGAKALLIGTAVAGALVAREWIPLFRAQPLLFWWVMFWGASQAASMRWFFRGLEWMKLLATVEVSTKVLALLGIFAFVHRPGDEWRVFAVQGFGWFLSFSICLILAYRNLLFRPPTIAAVREALHAGRHLFIYESSVNLYTTANTFILGLFAPPEIVGFYAGAERIVRASLRLQDPITQTFYPRVSHLVRRDPVQAQHLARFGAFILTATGAALGTLILLGAPELIRLLLGPGYAESVRILRILALLPLLAAMSTALVTQWAMPLGLERPMNVLSITVGVLNVGLASLLAWQFQAMGMAWVTVLAEASIVSGVYFMLRFRGSDPLVGTFISS